jgi:hypothetical protein
MALFDTSFFNFSAEVAAVSVLKDLWSRDVQGLIRNARQWIHSFEPYSS